MRFFSYIFFCCCFAIANASGEPANKPSVASEKLKKRSFLVNNKPMSAISLYNSPKYHIDELQHFSYVNPEAPKGGTFRIIQIGTFDNLNVFSKRSVAAESIDLLYDKLMQANKEEAATLYPLLATSLQILPDNKGVIFNLNPDAKFQDGSPVTAKDVAFSFKLLTQQGGFRYKSNYSEIDSVQVLNDHKVQFNFANKSNIELPYIAAEMPILSKSFGEIKDNNLDLPLVSGP